MQTIYKLLLVPFMVLAASYSYGQNYPVLGSTPSTEKNYVLTYKVRKPGVKDKLVLPSLKINEVTQEIQYLDGLGRVSQVITTKGAVGTGYKDIVEPIMYDAYGRNNKKYLPYANIDGLNNGKYKTTAINDQFTFYRTLGQRIDTTSFAYNETLFERSPFNRVLEQAAPGKGWRIADRTNNKNNHTVRTEYGFNGSTEVRLWNLTSNGASGTTFYAANQLYKTVVKDENWVESDGVSGLTKEFKDNEGHVVLKRLLFKNSNNQIDSLSTFYIYDDFGNLRYVIPSGVSSTSFTESDQLFKDFIYAYRYDGRQRVIEKKIPGAWWTHFVYNKLDQVIGSQDSVQRSRNEWTFSKYDGLGRSIMSGLYISSTRRSALQTIADNQTSLWETRTGGTHYGYTKLAWPQTSMKVLNVNYYDDYNFNSPSDYTYATDSLNVKSTMTRGLLTGSIVKILNSKDSLWRVNYYDNEGRMIQCHKKNIVGGKEVINNKYDFVDQLLVSKRVHTGRNGQTATILNWYEYDHMGRKLKVKEKINTEPAVTLVQYNYNEIGELTEKNLHSSNGSTYAQSVDYRYNTRGWLKSINNSTLTSDGGLSNDDTNDRFGMEMSYESGPVPQYNGNISSLKWKGAKLSSTLTAGQGYKFNYDKLNRLTAAVSTAGPNYSEYIGSYDKMGNILKLGRYSQGVKIDSLTYTYFNGGNQLQKVEDAATTEGFINGSTAATEYTYDANGNLLSDLNNGITVIAYNYLNQPQLLTKGSQKVQYTYDATGNKLKRTLVGYLDSIEYVSGIQYKNGLIDFIQTNEGRAIKNGTSYLYRYSLQDHLGNLRVEVDASGTALHEESYYAFGLTQTLPGNSELSAKNKYLYNNKELQDVSNWYDYGARFYDPVIGRWGVIDRKAELYFGWSIYSYALNSPVNAIDPDGNLVIFINGNHFGDGGCRSYWQKSHLEKVNFVDQMRNVIDKDFAGEVMDHFNDHKSIYRDGAIGGFNWAMDPNGRNCFGHLMGMYDVKSIIKSLARDKNGVIIESIKIIAHSMGGAYAKGYIRAIVNYAKNHPEECEGLQITEFDFASFQPGAQQAIDGVPLFQFSNNHDKVANNILLTSPYKPIKQRTGGKEDPNKSKGHSIFDYADKIAILEEGSYKFVNGEFVKQ